MMKKNGIGVRTGRNMEGSGRGGLTEDERKGSPVRGIEGG